ncbi:hypothetical protein COO60DRAFT_1211944 [Scenedesmus sp. NREL 46B-D3]|nr:hypothetical protein COO60DRAFT_1211944 [Scenedesmus sp. NREL 46B-D3]
MRSTSEHRLSRHAVVVLAFLVTISQVHCASLGHRDHALVQQQSQNRASRGNSTALEQQPLATQSTGSIRSSWCQPATGRSSQWQTLSAPGRAVLSKPDVIACSIMQLPVSHDPELLYTRTQLRVEQKESQATAAQLYQVLLLDCDAQFWQLAGLQDEEHVCLASTAALQASCNEWPLSPPVAGKASSETCAPPNTVLADMGTWQSVCLSCKHTGAQ